MLGKAHLGFCQMGNILKIVENAVLSQNAAIFTHPYWLCIFKLWITLLVFIFAVCFMPWGLVQFCYLFFPPINREQSPLATEERITVSVTPCGLPVNLTSVEDSVWYLLVSRLALIHIAVMKNSKEQIKGI